MTNISQITCISKQLNQISTQLTYRLVNFQSNVLPTSYQFKINTFHNQCFGVSSQFSLTDTLQTQSKGTNIQYWILEGETILALAVTDVRDGNIWISNVCTHHDHLRQGLMTRLLQHIINITCCDMNYYLNVAPNNNGAIELYTRLGFNMTTFQTINDHQLLIMKRDSYVS